MASPKPVCTECGACCVSPVDQDSFCDIEEKDEERLGIALVRRYVVYPSFFANLLGMTGGPQRRERPAIATAWRVQKSGTFKSYEFCTCVFLRGTVMKKVKCRVYDKRPDVCRKVMKPGDSACRKLRDAFLRKLKEMQKQLEED
jgi:Fe-S-cluster containining protein